MVDTITLPRALLGQLSAGHPWVYRDHIPPGFDAPSGALLKVRCGAFEGWGLWGLDSPVALRMLPIRGPKEWLEPLIRNAWDLRSPLREDRVSAYRWIHGEGDGLPGLVVDLYGAFAVLLTYTQAWEPHLSRVADALSRCAKLHGVVRRRKDKEEAGAELLSGRMPPRKLTVEEYGVRLLVDVHAGQKTGLFLDHRENRRFLSRWCAGRRVLNLFCYTGAFSLHAKKAGAGRVVQVDASATAMLAAAENLRLNGLEVDDADLVTMDVFDYLKDLQSRSEKFDVVICDPPSFAHSRDQLKQATKAYTRLTGAALSVVEPGGLYAAGSCTAQVGPDAFREILSASARLARRRLQVVHDVGQPLDHPVLAAHPEGRYLKFAIARVLPL